jgi:hypothetical protein
MQNSDHRLPGINNYLFSDRFMRAANLIVPKSDHRSLRSTETRGLTHTWYYKENIGSIFPSNKAGTNEIFPLFK